MSSLARHMLRPRINSGLWVRPISRSALPSQPFLVRGAAQYPHLQAVARDALRFPISSRPLAALALIRTSVPQVSSPHIGIASVQVQCGLQHRRLHSSPWMARQWGSGPDRHPTQVYLKPRYTLFQRFIQGLGWMTLILFVGPMAVLVVGPTVLSVALPLGGLGLLIAFVGVGFSGLLLVALPVLVLGVVGAMAAVALPVGSVYRQIKDIEPEDVTRSGTSEWQIMTHEQYRELHPSEQSHKVVNVSSAHYSLSSDGSRGVISITDDDENNDSSDWTMSPKVRSWVQQLLQEYRRVCMIVDDELVQRELDGEEWPDSVILYRKSHWLAITYPIAIPVDRQWTRVHRDAREIKSVDLQLWS
ncbi:uncharacterized protein BJ171DRAFT_512873 [Polychytrium aggregatum]|uniref:uncharacterized protein n=1 Tax=Polychytrium aggregatum TaxID=110093 RepID=UPI0022FE6A12|nr:uncharacterized protein BJ171DRAFT_512873 [Polychytrium aggregatum]KAI9202665.1 hypothetical protein BJ171DRAFT_512873 [Polychytrium aggregatum]